MSNAVPQKKTFFQIANKNFIMLFVAYTVICITHSMTNSVTSAGWRLAGMDLTTIGLIASAMSWAAFIIRPFSAPITDRGNKKLIYIAAVGALTLAVFMYSLSMDNSAFAVPAKIIHGVSWTFISTITAVIVSEYVPREDLGTAMGFFMISQMIASAVSPACGLCPGRVHGLCLHAAGLYRHLRLRSGAGVLHRPHQGPSAPARASPCSAA